MKLSTILVAGFAVTSNASILSMNYFADQNCKDFQVNVHITQAGHNKNNFGRQYKCFQVIETDHKCKITLYQKANYQGNKSGFGKEMTQGYNYYTTDSWGSFDVFCN